LSALHHVPWNNFSTPGLNKKIELMLTRRAKAYSSFCSQIQTVSLSSATSTRLLPGYPSCAGFLEPRQSRLGSSKSTFSAENFICSLSVYSNWFRPNSLLKCVSQPEIAKKSVKTSILVFKVIQGHWIRC